MKISKCGLLALLSFFVFFYAHAQNLSNNEVLIHINPINGSDMNDGSFMSPIKTLQAAAKKINKLPRVGVSYAGPIWSQKKLRFLVNV